MHISDRRLCAVSLGVAIIASVAMVVTAALVVGRGRREIGRGNPLGNPRGMVDRLVMLDEPKIWNEGTLEDVKVEGEHFVLAAGSAADYPRHGRWTSAQRTGDFAFTELIPSWNALVPAETGIAVAVRVRDAGDGAWSPWLDFGGWGKRPEVGHVVRFERGAVYTDTLMLDRPANAWQVRVDLAAFTFDEAATPALRRVAVSYSGVVADDAARRRLDPPLAIDGNWARKLEVPYRTQKDTPKALRGQVCSPTSVSMVLEYWGVNRPTVENALAMYDPEYREFGNWNRAVQRAGELGLDAWLTRFRSWDAVKAEVAKGRPVIASIKFGAGEFPSAALESTEGHLIVIRGFTPQGDAIVNDPANRKKGNGVIYPAAELGRAWFGCGGVGYVIAGPRKEEVKP